MSATAAPCPREGCAFLTTRVCVEGLAPEEYPFLSHAGTGSHEALAEAGEDAVSVAGDGEKVVTIAASIHLSAQDADRIRRGTGASLVAFVGAFKSGKTSLVTEFWEMLRRRDMRGFSFAGSDTVSGFEHRAFLSRMESGGSDDGIFRTSSEAGLHFLHLRLARQDGSGPPFHLLMSDRAGETIEELLDEPGEFARLVEVSHADTVALVVDGAQMADPARRGQHRLQTMSIVQAIRDAGLLKHGTRVDVVMAKLDKVRLSGNQGDAELGFESLLEGIRKVLRRDAAIIAGHRVAARSDDPNTPRGLGLEQLLELWTRPVKAAVVKPFEIDVEGGDAFAALLAARRRRA